MRTSISFQPTDCIGQLYAECKTEEAHFSRKLHEIVRRYESLCTTVMPQNLTRKQWLALISAHWSHAFTDADYGTNTLHLNILDADLNELSPDDEPMGDSERKSLARKVRDFRKAEQFVVVDALERLCGADTRTINRFVNRHAQVTFSPDPVTGELKRDMGRDAEDEPD